MTSRRDKKLKELKRSHTWIWIILFTILILISGVLTVMFLSISAQSLIESKLVSEQTSVKHMADVYETCIRGGIDPTEILKSFGRDYIITDSSHNVIGSFGSNTCDLNTEKSDNTELHFTLNVYLGIENVYRDTQAPILSGEGEDSVFDISAIMSDIEKYLSLPDDEEKLRPYRLDDPNRKMLSLPLWIGISAEDGSREFIASSVISVDIDDFGLFLVLLVNTGLLVTIIYIVMLTTLISGISRRKKTLKVFFTDAVTQGNNFMFFVYKGEEMLKKRRNYANRYAVVNLKFVGYRNYCICHSVVEGEKMLALIYKNIESLILPKKEICAHISEADFALLVRDPDDEAVKARMKSVTEALSKLDSLHELAFHAGITAIEPDGLPEKRKNIDISEIYNNACTARETLDKTDGSGIAFFSERFVEDRRWVDAVQEHQRKALENEEFVVYYQPKYDPRTDELSGAEALIRWQSPEFGFVPPGRMIPIFEKNGFITEIDHYMISHVARDQKHWLDSGCRCVPVSVNVSRSHFIESDLAEQIRDAVDAEGTPHELIEIELTESAFFDDKKAMINTITKLKEYGFAVSMDDFGSGYSSLNSLKDMPLDVLKLDAEFFRGESDGKRGEIVVSEAIKLAKNLNMRTVAEGVEIREQVDFLALQGCDMIQGYFYAKPMNGADYEVRMKERFRPKDEV